MKKEGKEGGEERGGEERGRGEKRERKGGKESKGRSHNVLSALDHTHTYLSAATELGVQKAESGLEGLWVEGREPS